MLFVVKGLSRATSNCGRPARELITNRLITATWKTNKVTLPCERSERTPHVELIVSDSARRAR